MTVKVGTLSADLDLDGNPFERNLDRMMATGAQRATQIGDKMTAGVTLPLVALGGAAVKMGMEFDTSMSRIVGLVGLSTGEVDELRGSVLGLAGETAKSPQELADALFTVTSAGFRGTEAMGVLEQAAKASAAGMGETRDIAEALTGAINAYGPEVLDAAQATDILVATARAGNFETSQLAGSLGQVTPFAKQAGASFADVGGAISLLTRVNNDASQSITQISALMRAFVVPTAEATTALEGIGMTAEDVRDSIGQNGLVATLQMLDEKLGGNREQLGRLLGSSEAASAAFQILEADAATLEGTFGVVGDAAGMTGEAFDAAADTPAFKLQQALAKIQTALIDLGGQIAPFVALVATGIGTVADVFGALPDGVQTAVIAFGALLASVGPLLSIGGRVAQAWGTISKTFDAAATGAFSLAGNLRQVAAGGAALAAAALAVKLYGDMMSDAREEGEKFADSIRQSFDPKNASYAETTAALEELRGKQRELNEAQDDSFFGRNTINKDYNEALRTASEETGVFGDEMEAALARADQLAAEMGITAEEAYRLANTEETLATALNDTTGEFDAQAAAVSAADQQIQEYSNTLHAQMDPLFAAEDAMLRNAEAQKAVQAAQMEALVAQQELEEAIKTHGRESDEAALASLNLAAAQEAVTDANRDAARTAMDVNTAANELATKMRDGTLSIGGAREQLRLWVEQGLITEEQARQVAGELAGVATQASSLQGRNITIPVGADTSAFERQIADIYRMSTPAIRISVAGGGGIPLGVESRWTGGPMLPGKDYIVGEEGPEFIRASGGAAVIENAGRTRSMRESAGADGVHGRSGRTVNVQIIVHKGDQIDENTVASLVARRLS